MRVGRVAASERVVVVGAGALGGWTALQLQRRGAQVTLIDAFGAGNPRASSGGETRIIRAVYGDSRLNTGLATRALELWRHELGDDGAGLLQTTGLLWLVPQGRGDGYLQAARPLLSELGVQLDEVSISDLGRRFPVVSDAGLEAAYFEPEAGVLFAREACRRVVRVFERYGGTSRHAVATTEPIASEGGSLAVRLTDGSRVPADQIVFACGPWLPNLFPDVLGPLIVPSRQEVVFVGPPAGDGRFCSPAMPAWIELGERIFYGLPSLDGRGVKIADDTRGERVDPDTLDRLADPAAVERGRRALARRFPALAGAPVVETRVCQYENSPDGDLIVDRHPEHPRVWLVGGGSGHAFKLGPAIGELVAAAVLGGPETPAELSLRRFEGSLGPRATQFDRGGVAS